MLIELRQPIYLETPLGGAEARFLEYQGVKETAALWGCFQTETKENWWWPNPLVRIRESISAMRDEYRSPIHLTEEEIATLAPHI